MVGRITGGGFKSTYQAEDVLANLGWVVVSNSFCFYFHPGNDPI